MTQPMPKNKPPISSKQGFSPLGSIYVLKTRLMPKIQSLVANPMAWTMLTLVILTAVDAYMTFGIMPYVVVLMTAWVLVLVGLGYIKPKDYSIVVYGIALATLWQTSMLGHYVVGSDINAEVWASIVAKANGWNPMWREANNTSIVPGLIAPAISWITSLNLIMVYKLVLPAIFALTPVILFWAFKRQMPDKQAFFASMFFIIMPVFTLEITAIGKSMVAEVFFALMIFAMVSKLQSKWKVLAILGSLGMTALCHYTLGFLALCYLLGIIIVRLATKPLKWSLWQGSKIRIWAMALVFVIVLLSGYAYYTTAAQGYIVEMITYSGKTYQNFATTLVEPNGIDVSSVEPVTTGPSSSSDSTTISDEAPKTMYLNEQPPLVRTGIGLDFTQVTLLGKIFRIIQYITQALIVMGFIYVLFKWKRYNFTPEFMGGVVSSFILLLCCIFIPAFSGLINMTRFYQLSLFFLAPMFVLGFEVFNRSKNV